MKRPSVLVFCLLYLTAAVAPATARAETNTLLPPIVINEIQTNGVGTGTTHHEFIELFNAGEVTIDISDWKLVYTPSNGLTSSEKTLITFPTGTLLHAAGSLLVTPSDYLVDITPKFTYAAGSAIAAKTGSVTLVNNIALTVDLVGWGTVATTLHETNLATAPLEGSSISRKVVDDAVVDTNDNFADFEATTPSTPQTSNVPPAPEPEPDPEEPPEPPQEEPPTTETPPTEEVVVPTNPPEEPTPEPTAPAPQTKKLYINELFVDPDSPLADANDEWIEIYNPSDEAVDLVNYAVFSGRTFSYQYRFTIDQTIAPKGYIVVTSGATSIALSNSGGAARIVAPNGEVLDEVSYSEAEVGQAWAKAENGVWSWTTTPTEASQNVITIVSPDVLKAAAAKNAASKKKKSTKKTAVKAAKKSTKKSNTSSKYDDDAALISAPTPLPWWLLASLLGLALLYVGYEYRFEITNSLYRFKQYRNNRR